MLVMAIGTASFVTANQFAKEKMTEYQIAKSGAEGFKAFLLAKAGMQGALGALKKIPEEVLYQSGIAFNPPPVPLGGGTIYYKMTPEDGKININFLVQAYNQQPNLRMLEMMHRLYEQLGIPREKLSAVIDWIDENSEETGGGAEVFYYSGLKPPRKIKNNQLYNLSELTSVKGYDRKLVYESLKPKDYDKNYSKDFLSEEEKVLISDSDFVLSNNITAYVPFRDTGEERVNINAAPYHVLMSLSDFMTRQAAMRILKFKIEQGGYIKEIKDLEKFTEFQTKTTTGYTLFNELAGDSGGASAQPNQQQQQRPQPTSSSSTQNPQTQAPSLNSGRVKTKGEIYRIIGVGKIGKTVRKVTCLFDLPNDQILYYAED
ncbi:MAG: type II secretion system protein GspK [Leptospiraceae bacterium]|nr:type II secretion system protein GspK [Leptospiraceae bacterium]